jgi:integrase
VALDAETADLLRRHRRAQLEERMAAGPAWRNEDWIFCRPDGSHVPPMWLLARFRELAIAAGLPAIKLHEGRHTAATLGLEAGVPLKVVSDQLGHSGIGITGDLYTHVRPARHDEAAERVAQLLFPTRRDVTGSGDEAP